MQQQRTRIAQATAVLILEHGFTDWLDAKRKAARQLLLPENSALPGNDEIEAALFEHQSLFGTLVNGVHASLLRAKRQQALVWMDRLAAFSPKLYGALAEGWGGEHQDIRLDLVAEDSKAVELRLIDDGIRYHAVSENVSAAASSRGAAENVVLRADDGDSEALLHINTPTARQQRSKTARRALDRAILGALLGSEISTK
ncbi:MAG: UDP-N-acetylmuramate--alanine ligase [Burkholderiales bacterium]|nr:UDP-N-acetylmuramate--alanine ligase [Burkholderiales bacterium]